jgi:EAL domain-containing protein (putative c-di-GMP-specific phosphodiesterase class I)
LQHSADETQLLVDLSGAVGRGEIVAYFQPQIDVTSGAVVGVEALCRWEHPQRGLLAPISFIPLAEDEGLIHGLGAFMLTAGARQADRWHRRGFELDIAVNVSALQLEKPAFVELVAETLQSVSFDPHHLTLEITESAPVEATDATRASLEALSELGVGISVDDFGTGHSTLDQLRSLPATEVKLDKSLVHRHVEAELTEIVDAAQHRGLRVVAEGVESAEHMERARELHCDRAQGYLIAPPSTPEQLDLLLAR